jgi:uncharacterized protein DUF6448
MEDEMTARMTSTPLGPLLATLIMIVCVPQALFAHCDTMDGPVVKAARAALVQGDLTPVLKWVKAEHEQEVRAAFAKTLEVRKAGSAARELADRYFFETLVRIHREGEGEPYTGLKPSGTDPGPGIAAADRALSKGSVDELLSSTTAQMTTKTRELYRQAAEKRKHAEESVQAGRDYVNAYVAFIHFMERLQEDLIEPAGHDEVHGETEKDSAHPHR